MMSRVSIDMFELSDWQCLHAMGCSPHKPEILVVSEQRRLFQQMKQRNDVRVLNPRSGDFPAHAPGFHPPFSEKVFLIVPDIFIQQIHAARRPLCEQASRPRASSNAPRASAMVSKIASLLTRPPHALTISSTDIPCSNSSRTCQTMMRVPL
jgi:hypothetical protein